MAPEDNNSNDTVVSSSPLLDTDVPTLDNETDAVSESAERIQNLEQFIVENLYTDENEVDAVSNSSETPDNPEISEGEKSVLFFAPDYRPTSEEIAQRKENIEKSEYEFKPIEEIVADIELIDAKEKADNETEEPQEKKKEPTIVKKFKALVKRIDSIKTIKEKGFTKEEAEEVIQHYVSKGDNPVLIRTHVAWVGKIAESLMNSQKTDAKKSSDLSRREILNLAVKGYDRLNESFSSKSYFGGLKIYGSDSDEDFKKDIRSRYGSRALSPQDVVDIATSSDHQWEQLRQNLSQIPYLTDKSTNLHSRVRILNNGFSDSQKKQLESIKNNRMFVQKVGTVKKDDFWGGCIESPKEDLNGFIFNLTGGGEKGIQQNKDEQNVRAYQTYSGSPPWKGERITQDLQYLRYSLVRGDIYQKGGEELYKEVGKYLSSSDDKAEGEFGLDQDKISMIKTFIKSEGKFEDSLKTFKWITDPGNYDVIERINRLHNLGISVDKEGNFPDMKKQDLTAKLETLEKSAISHLTADTTLEINNFEELEQFVHKSPENLQIFKFLNEYNDIFSTKDTFSLEELQTMFNVKDDEIYPTKQYWEHLCRNNEICKIRNKEKFIKLEHTNRIEEPYARAFWGLVATHPKKQDKILSVITDTSFGYEGFVKGYVNISEEGYFLNENFYRSIIGSSCLREELSDQEVSGSQHMIGRIFLYIDQKDIEKFGNPKARFFWSLGEKFGLKDDNYANLCSRLLLETYTKISDSNDPNEIKYVLDGGFNYDGFVDRFAYEFIDANGEVTYGLNANFIKALAVRELELFQENMSLIDDSFIESIGSEEGKIFWSLFRDADASLRSTLMECVKPEESPGNSDEKVFNYTREFNYDEFISKYRYELIGKDGAVIQGFNENFINFLRTTKQSLLLENMSLIDDSFIESIGSEEGKEFWPFFRNCDPSIYLIILEKLKDENNPQAYSQFVGNYTQVVESEGLSKRILNERFIKFLGSTNPTLLWANKSLMDDTFIESIDSTEGKEFWAFFRNYDSSIFSVMLVELGDENDPQEYSQFLGNYTRIVKSDGKSVRVFSEDFIRKFAKITPNVMINSMKDIISEETLQGFSEAGRAFWKGLSEIEEDRVKRAVLSFYNQNQGVTMEHIKSFTSVLQKIENSPSEEILKLKDNILNSLCTSGKTIEQVEREYSLLENIFIRNNSPIALLRSRVFDSLYLKEKLIQNGPDKNISEEFKNILRNPEFTEEQKARVLSELIKNDLLNIAKDSIDENLFNFLLSLRDGADALTFYDRFIQQGYSDEEILSVLGEEEREFLAKSLDIFFVANQGVSTKEDISERINELRDFLGINKQESLSIGIYKTYIEPLVDSPTRDLHVDVRGIFEEMSSTKQKTHLRGLEYVSGRRKIEILDGDQTKRVGSLTGMIEDGVLAKDYLGAQATQDYTPYDTDTMMARDVNAYESFHETLQENVADTGFGGIILVIRNRGQFKNPRAEKTNYPNPHAQYEIIRSKYYGSRNCGIRTGVATTEIDFICFDEEIFQRESKELRDKDFQLLKFHIASKGIYIPVINNQGEVIYTPEEFEKQRETFAGVLGPSGKPFQVQSSITQINPALEEITEGFSKDREKIAEISTHIQEAITTELKERNLLFEDSITGLEGLRIEHIGSTSRLTHVIGSSDFDFSILLDRNQLKHLSDEERNQLINNVMENIGTVQEPGERYKPDEDTLQSTGSKIKLASREVIEFDLAVTDKKGNLDGSNSHEFVINRLNSIKESQGEEAYKFVVANILFAKKFLKQNQCYKKRFKEGGMGGIGIENWILQHHGNFEEAVEAFLDAARNPDGKYDDDFDRFKGCYTVFDPGKDIRSGRHDNFVSDNMTQVGYQKMLGALDAFKRGEINLKNVEWSI